MVRDFYLPEVKMQINPKMKIKIKLLTNAIANITL